MPNDHYVRTIRWSVIWRKKGRWVRKRFHDDFQAALSFFLEKQTQQATLHSDNKAWPPPTRITEHEHVSWKIIKRGGKRYKQKTTTVVNLLHEYKNKGVWWCPYCIKLRRFAFMQTERGPEAYCPVCQITNYDSSTRRHNPKAVAIEYHQPQRRTRGRSRRRRRG